MPHLPEGQLAVMEQEEGLAIPTSAPLLASALDILAPSTEVLVRLTVSVLKLVPLFASTVRSPCYHCRTRFLR